MIGNNTVTLAHGAGGKQTSELIDRVFKSHFQNPLFTADDAAVIQMEKGRIAMSTDGFIVSPGIEVISSGVIDKDFKYSDHNPMVLEFRITE